MRKFLLTLTAGIITLGAATTAADANWANHRFVAAYPAPVFVAPVVNPVIYTQPVYPAPVYVAPAYPHRVAWVRWHRWHEWAEHHAYW